LVEVLKCSLLRLVHLDNVNVLIEQYCKSLPITYIVNVLLLDYTFYITHRPRDI
jgi:hypothetical protein